MREQRKILFAASEALPFASTGGLGDVIGSLPMVLAAGGANDVRVMLPFYADIPEKYRAGFELLGELDVYLAWRKQHCRVYQLTYEGVIFYFLENDYYYNRPGLYGYYDDGERFAFFSKAVLAVADKLNFVPDLIHVHDWQAALVPIFYQAFYRSAAGWEDVKTMLTIHNIEYQGKFNRSVLGDLFGLAAEWLPVLEFKGLLNLIKGAICVVDKVGTVSYSYSRELHYAHFAHGLENIIAENSHKMTGILNGINQEMYNPKTDPALFVNYTYRSLDKKAVNKAHLQQLVNLPENPDTPVVAIISRMVEAKGFDLLMCVMEELLSEKVQFVVLGCGDKKYEDFFRWTSYKYPAKVAALITYDRDLSHKIYAGADLLLMPSMVEPCGLAQMIASRYGTVPIVRATGGLRDSITDYESNGGNGFVFENFNAHEMLAAIRRSLALYGDKEAWTKLCGCVMRKDFSWKKSADDYLKVYDELLK